MWDSLFNLFYAVVFLGIPGGSIAWLCISLVRFFNAKENTPELYRIRRGRLIASVVSSIVLFVVVLALLLLLMLEIGNM